VSAAAEGGGQALCAMSATELAAAIRAKEISPVEVINAVLVQIERLNPAINAFVTVTDDIAREQASAAEAAVMRGEELGPIHGVPYSIKDLTPTKSARQ
jgi:Asp-tRNA(Asn)/Glu-tRNA(Gln) amidotransferase A subunit family amidase